jgi:hypothetical protein
MAASVKEVFRKMSVPIDFEELIISGAISTDPGVIDQAVRSIKKNQVALKGLSTSCYMSANVVKCFDISSAVIYVAA